MNPAAPTAVGLLRVAHNTTSVVQLQAPPFADAHGPPLGGATDPP